MSRHLDGLRFQLWRLRDALRDRLFGTAHRREVFSRIHAGNLWGDRESVSGGGSNLEATANLRGQLPEVLRRFGVRSVLDAPCGDFLWMQHVVDALDSYVGVDIVPNLVTRNQESFGGGKTSFLCADITTDPLPRADLVLCRDCFIHLPTRLIIKALANFSRSGARYVLLTNSARVPAYRDIPVGSFREIDFRQPPFNFPEPLSTITEDGSATRELSLWAIADLMPMIDGKRELP